MKKLLIFIPILAVLAYFIFRTKKKIAGAAKIDISIDTLKLNIDGYKDIASGLLTGYNLTTGIILKNISEESYKIDNVKINVFTESGVKIANQESIFTDPVMIYPKKENLLSLDYTISASAIRQLIKESGESLTLVQALTNYIDTEIFGVNVILKGFITVAGFDIKINEKTTL